MTQLNLQQLIDEVATWSDATFGETSTPASKLKHLQKEIPELLEALQNNEVNTKSEDIRLEFADCMLLLLDAARKCNFSAEEILSFTKEKLEINKKRTWKKPDENGIFEHVRDI